MTPDTVSTQPSATQPSATQRSALSRRGLLKGALAGGALAMAPIRFFDAEAAAAPASNGIFGYGVASGDPTPDRVIIWTRATPSKGVRPGQDGGPGLTVKWEVSSDNAFAHIVASGKVETAHASDYTVKVDVTKLSPYTRYYYRFTAGGETSRIGRTQTAPKDTDLRALRFGLVTCSNYTGGYFSAYRVLGARDDIDFVMHVGDYIYEYGNVPSSELTSAGKSGDRYGPKQLVEVRDGMPADDLILLKDYRLRHGLHKADPDAQLTHQQTPWITIFDDHEVANNTWDNGAENQHPTTPNGRTEPAFLTRRASAYQAYLEWMPFRYPVLHSQQVPHQGQQFFRRFAFGAVADLSVVETRQNRSGQINADGTTGYDGTATTGGGAFVDMRTVARVDAATADRHMPEPEQVTWLADNVNATGKPWHLIGNQVMFTPVRYPGAVVGVAAAIAVNSDQWDGYPANQAAVIGLLNAAPKTSGDAVVLTGDIHSSWACDIPINQATYVAGLAGNSAAVEFVTPSVTSDGFYEVVSAATKAATPEAGVATTKGVTGAVMAATPWVRYLDGVGHGFTIVDVTPARVQVDYYLTPDPTTAQPEPRAVQSVVPTYRTSYQTVAGTRQISAATGPVGPRADIAADASAAPAAALPDGVGAAAVAGALGVAGFIAFSKRRAALEASELTD